jgi:transcriptional regulator with XRE-family HTH domain
MGRPLRISDQLKVAVRASGQSLKQIAQGSGISPSGLGRFVSDNGERHSDIQVEATVDRLAEYLGLDLVPEQSISKSKPEGRRKPKRPAKKSAAKKAKR